MQGQPSSIFESSNFASKLNEKLLSFSEDEKFSDICIIASDNVRFHAHKCVLSAFSDYFMVMFGGNLKEATASEVKIHEVNGKVFKQILTFLYTGRIELHNDTIEDILRAANFFQILPLISECYNFFGENLNAKNCLSMAMFADQHGFIELSKKSSKFASANFEKVCSCKEFLKLEENQLSAIVSSEDLCVTSEAAVFLNLIKWIEHDKPNREKSASNLFSKVRYWLLKPEFIKQNRSKLPKNVQTIEMVCNWLEWHSLPDSQRESKGIELSKPENNRILFVGGGGIQTYDPVLRNWSREEVSNLPSRFVNIVLFENQLIFSTDGFDLKSFDLQTKKMTINGFQGMITPRSSSALAVLKGELYAIGGYNGQNNSHYSRWLRVVEKYNPTTRKWHTAVPMNKVLASPKAVVVNDELYVVGKSSSFMECLGRFTNEWTSKPFPNDTNSAFGFTAVANRLIYKIGGLYEINCKQYYHTIVQCFDAYQNSWSEETKIKIPLADTHCVAKFGGLIICGGRDDTGSYLNLVQEYNTCSHKWTILSPLIEYKPLKYNYGLVAL